MTAAATTATGTTLAPVSDGSWGRVLGIGGIGAAIAIYLSLVGIVSVIGERALVRDTITLGQAALILTGIAVGAVAATRGPAGPGPMLAAGAIAGAVTGLALTLLIILNAVVPLRPVLPNVSPALLDALTFESDPATSGAWIPLVVLTLLGVVGAMLVVMPRLVRRLIVFNVLAIVAVGLFSGLVRTPMLSGPLSGLGRQLFASEGLTTTGAIVTLAVTSLLVIGYDTLRVRQRVSAMTPTQRQRAGIPLGVVFVLFILWLPLGLGNFAALAIALIALYALMGLGLNITLGLAGLLDLGFVAFFAVGAYTVALLTSTGPLGIAQLSWWVAVPFAVLAAMLFGLVLGLPILGIRGDYLAIATLGFGEIIAMLVRSDLLGPWLGGPQGITNVPAPIPTQPTDFLAGPVQIYYIALVGAAIVAFVAYRLRGSRLGRAWLAIREDEDVAEALGVNLVQTKSLAYMLGAAFAGLSGAIFAPLITSIFPSSINVYVSINVAAIVIVGGMGSIPGVILGAVFLIGVPELFREFSEYRFLFYGIVLMLVMRYRPQGLLPSRISKREMTAQEDPDTDAAVPTNQRLPGGAA